MLTRRILVAVSALALVVAGTLPATAAYVSSPRTSSSAMFNPIQGCWITFGGSKSSNQAHAYDTYNSCIGAVGVRTYFQPNANIGEQQSSIYWNANYAVTPSFYEFRAARGYYDL